MVVSVMLMRPDLCKPLDDLLDSLTHMAMSPVVEAKRIWQPYGGFYKV